MNAFERSEQIKMNLLKGVEASAQSGAPLEDAILIASDEVWGPGELEQRAKEIYVNFADVKQSQGIEAHPELEAEAINLFETGKNVDEVLTELSTCSFAQKRPSSYVKLVRQTFEKYKGRRLEVLADWTLVEKDIKKGLSYTELKSKYYDAFTKTGIAPTAFMKRLDALSDAQPKEVTITAAPPAGKAQITLSQADKDLITYAKGVSFDPQIRSKQGLLMKVATRNLTLHSNWSIERIERLGVKLWAEREKRDLKVIGNI